MSYDLMVFNPEATPANRIDFMAWYTEQTKWGEGHSYNDPAVTIDRLRAWFMEMIETFPAMNGPFATDNEDEWVTDYCIGKNVIYVTFAWSVAEEAYEAMKRTAAAHRVGFFDVSATDGDILFPDADGVSRPIDMPDNLSSIEQIKSWAPPGQPNKRVREIVFDRIKASLPDFEEVVPKKQPWWKKFLGRSGEA